MLQSFDYDAADRVDAASVPVLRPRSIQNTDRVVDVRETEKDPDAFRTISEVAEDLSLPQHVLRFWESRFHQIRPIKRGGGRRFYRPEDVDLLRGIRHLLYEEGYTIKGAQKILKEQGIRHVQDLGMEADAAAMRSTSEVEGPAPSEQEIGGFGGILGGFLPRRRSREHEGGGNTHEEPSFAENVVTDEPHLPFPELSTSLKPQLPGENAPLRGRAVTQRVEEHVNEEHRFDGDLNAIQQVSDTANETEDQDPVAPVDEPEQPQDSQKQGAVPVEWKAPSFAPQRDETHPDQYVRPMRPARVEVSMQRPSRGPAAHISSAPYPEFSDPMLPFMEEPALEDEFSESLEERIRRLKAQDQASEIPNEPGPPDEYVPLRYRHASPETPRDGISSDEGEPEAFPSIVRPTDASTTTVNEQRHEPYLEEDISCQNEVTNDAWAATALEDEARPLEPEDDPSLLAGKDDVNHHVAAFRTDTPFSSLTDEITDAPGSRDEDLFASSSQEYMAAPHHDQSFEDQEGPDMETSPRPRRFGPFTAPVVEEYELPPLDSARLAEIRSATRSSDWDEPSPVRPGAQPAAYWDAEPRPERMPRATQPYRRYGMDPLETTAAESYPHQAPPPRMDVRASGPGVLPVLSRADIHRLQAALYELSECQRLMAEVMEEKKS